MTNVKKNETATAAKPVAEVKEAAAKPVEAKAVAKKPAVKKTTAKKAPAKKVAASTITIQFDNKSYTPETLTQIAKDVWKYDLKKKASELDTIELYVKPEDSAVYYVFNKEIEGSFLI